MDSFRGFVFERFVSWICFVKNFFPNYSIRFISEGFVYESRILRKNTIQFDDQLGNLSKQNIS